MLVDLVCGGDAVAVAVLEAVARRRDAENLLDGQISLEVVDQDGFGPGAVAAGSARVLAEHEAVEDLDLGAHEEVQRDIERLAEADQNGRRRHHLARLVLADRLRADPRIHPLGKRPQGEACSLPGEPKSLSEHEVVPFRVVYG